MNTFDKTSAHRGTSRFVVRNKKPTLFQALAAASQSSSRNISGFNSTIFLGRHGHVFHCSVCRTCFRRKTPRHHARWPCKLYSPHTTALHLAMELPCFQEGWSGPSPSTQKCSRRAIDLYTSGSYKYLVKFFCVCKYVCACVRHGAFPSVCVVVLASFTPPILSARASKQLPKPQ